MASVKVEQKFAKPAFAEMLAQIKAGTMHVVTTEEGKATVASDVVGKVTNAFNLGKKVDFMVTFNASEQPKQATYRLRFVADHWLLIQSQGE